MRLLVVSQYFWPEDFRVNDLVKGLVERGHSVTVLTGLPNYPEGRVFPAYADRPQEFREYHGAEVVRVPIMPRGKGSFRLALNYVSFALTAALFGAWKLRGRTFEAIFVFQTSPVTAALPALLLGRLKRAPVLMWILDLWPETLSAIGVVRSTRILALVSLLVRFIYKRCDQILVQSRAFNASVMAHGGGADRLRYFPNWIEPIFQNGSAAASPAPELSEFGSTFNILFAGNIGEAQDLPSVLDAAEACRDMADVRWLIVGDGRAMEHLRSEIARRDLASLVRLLGRHPVDRMPAFFTCADALLVSLKDEPVWSMTIPGKVQSYLAAGRPILAMLNGEGARVVAESGGGLTASAGSGADLARAVRELRGLTAAERQAMGHRGRAYALRSFDRNKLFDELECWMREASASRRPAA